MFWKNAVSMGLILEMLYYLFKKSDLKTIYYFRLQLHFSKKTCNDLISLRNKLIEILTYIQTKLKYKIHYFIF
jgi:hypothetical protein